MVVVKLQNFGGMIPAVDSQLLPQNSASRAENAWLNSGAAEGFPQLRKIYDPLSTSANRVYRVPIDSPAVNRIPDSYWLEFDSPFTYVIQAPTLGDSFERFYWASNIDVPHYTTKQRIVDSDPPLVLGIPAPTVAPGVGVTGGSAPTESRAYVYTWVSDFGEEGPPSPPTLFTGNSDGTWNLTFTAPTVGDTTDRLLDKVRIYRTVSGVGGETDYFFVAEQDIADTTYDDSITSVTNNRLLESIFWTAPPSDLKGLVAMPNGITAGWRENEIWFSEPYRPHAWPVTYQVAVDSKVVGCGVLGQSLIVCTEGAPYAISGINPGSMSISRLATLEPCTAPGSIVSTPIGVVYTSTNGLILANATAAIPMTRQMIDREQWAEFLNLPTIFGAAFNGGYYCFGSKAVGCFSAAGFDPDSFLQIDLTGALTGAFIDPNDQRIAYTILKTDIPIRDVQNDYWTGEVFIHRDDGVYWLDQDLSRVREPYLWRSKILEAPNKRNFQAMRVYFREYPNQPEQDSVQDFSTPQTLKDGQWGLVRVYADGVLRFTRELRKSGEFFRLPSGFKATFWEVEVEARVRLNSIEMATSAKELMNV